MISLCHPHLDAWNVKAMAGALAAILDYEVKGHTAGMVEQGAGRSVNC